MKTPVKEEKTHSAMTYNRFSTQEWDRQSTEGASLTQKNYIFVVVALNRNLHFK